MFTHMMCCDKSNVDICHATNDTKPTKHEILHELLWEWMLAALRNESQDTIMVHYMMTLHLCILR